jgi:hypothetical protein
MFNDRFNAGENLYFFLDEACFTVRMNTSSQYNRYWCYRNHPHAVHLGPLHEKVGDLYAASAYKIIRPCFSKKQILIMLIYYPGN